MMKKVLAFVLVLALATGCCFGAMASTTYSSVVFSILTDYTASDFLEVPTATLAVFLLEQYMQDNSFFDKISITSGYSYIAN